MGRWDACLHDAWYASIVHSASPFSPSSAPVTRDASRIPPAARSLALQILASLEDDRRTSDDAQDRADRLVRRTEDERDALHRVCDAACRQADSLSQPASLLGLEGELDRESARLVARETARADLDGSLRELQARRRELEEESERHGRRSTAQHERLVRLRNDQASSTGLAPWDASILAVLREQGALPVLSPGTRQLLRGVEAAALVQKALSVSRSHYYDRFRPLLLTHHLSPLELGHGMDGSVWIERRQSGMRLRLDEVEALVRFVETGSVLVTTEEWAPPT